MESASEVRHLQVLRSFSVSKRNDTPNEDRVARSIDNRSCALSDGASISFDSAPWASILSQRFVANPDISRDWLHDAITEYQLSYDRELMSWSHQAAFDRGSFATLLGVVCSADGLRARAFAYGDTLLAIMDKGKLVQTIPYSSADEFDQSPKLLSTSILENNELDDEAISCSWHEILISGHEELAILLMTDAIGHWLLSQSDSNRALSLLALNDDDSFSNFIEAERAEGRMRRDDSSLVVIG